MPDNVITNILDRLPVRDAVKTDVLSKNWKFKWTLLTHLIFDEDFFRYLPDKFGGKIISRLLLHLKGPITKFVLYMPVEDDEYTLDLEEFKHWVMFFSRRGIKEVTLECMDGNVFDLPTQLHSCIELKHLELYNVSIPALPGFHGFPNLLSLHLNDVVFGRYTFGEFISRCPLLEILSYYDLHDTRELELIEISKLPNLKNLSWSVCMDDRTDMIKSSSFYQLTALAKLQELNLEFGCGEFMAEAGVDKKVPADFLCLKTLTLSNVNFRCDIMASFVLKMICNSPNLQTLNIKGAYNYDVSSSAVCSLDLGNTMKQLQLRSVSFSSYRGSENEVCLIKFILASSPLLKMIVVRVDQHFVRRHAESKRYDIAWRMAGKLLNLHRASPIVEIDLC
ncbi:F-box/FBD/LRR-repeat protein-like protein [Tanacetum coccineum]